MPRDRWLFERLTEAVLKGLSEGERVSLRQLADVLMRQFKLPFRVGLSHGQAFNGVIGRSEFGNRVTIGQPIMNARVMAQVARANELIVDGPVLERLGDTAKTSLVQGPGGYAMPGLEEMRRIEELTLPDEV